jgi:hypothetical protein
MFGGFEDLKCTPRADGGIRFEDHATYVSRFRETAQTLVADGFLLQEDADRLIAEAEASDVGTPEACAPAPALLPESGGSASIGLEVWAALLAGLVLVGAGIGLRRWTAVFRL